MPKRSGEQALHPSDAELLRALDSVRARCDVDARRARDPVQFVHRYQDPETQELVGLVASALAFGNVKALCAKIEDALMRMGPDIKATADSEAVLQKRLSGFRHRLYKGADLARLLLGARRVQRAHGSLGQAFKKALDEHETLRDALAAWVDSIRAAGGFSEDTDSVGMAHILPDPRKGSAMKRVLLYLRWMVRGPDGVDLGLWRISPAKLVIPVDTHIHKLSRNLGLTRRNAADYRAAEEITRALARLCPEDPVRYDFSLCHLGMAQSCPSKRDEQICSSCGVRPVCRHWQRQKELVTLGQKRGKSR